MRKVGVIADELVEKLFLAREQAKDDEMKQIWLRKVAEVTRSRAKERKYAKTTH